MRVQQFGYDANARLQSERDFKVAQLTAWLANNASPATTATTYDYDAVGNRSSKTTTTSAGTESVGYAYDANDRLTNEALSTPTGSTVTTTYTWDSNGNLASKTTPSEYTAYIFDADNRLIEVKRGASQATATSLSKYGYDAEGQRIRKQTPSATTHYLIDSTTTWPQVALEKAFTASGTQATANIWGEQLRQQSKGPQGSATTAPSEEVIPLQGHLSTTIAAIDRGGSAIERYETSAFGATLGGDSSSPKATHQHTGEYWDADARLFYLRERWYDPTTGRMASVDPVRGNSANPRSLNRYTYANAEPINNVDPSGAFTLGELNVGIQTQLTAVRTAFVEGGKRAGGKALQELGKLVENGVKQLIESCLKPNAKSLPGKQLTTNKTKENALIDFFFEMEGKVKHVEVKYQLPAGTSSSAFHRAAKQLQALADTGKDALLIAFKDIKSNARAKNLLESMSGNASQVQVLQGLVGLGAFLGEMVIEGCLP